MDSIPEFAENYPEMCTIFTVALGKKVLYGNNEDNQRSPDETFVAFVPRQEIPHSWSNPGVEGSSEMHGFMLLGVLEGNKLFPQGGVNDVGFCYDINGLPPVRFNGHSGIPWRDEWFNCFDLLWNCGTVKEVEKWYQNHQVPPQTWYGGQFHFADATGDAMVLSIDPSGEYAFTWKDDNHFLVSTNFNLVAPENCHGYPCRRFDTATEMLQSMDEDTLSVSKCAEILDAVHIEYKNRNGTVYSNIFDLVSKRAYVYHLHDFNNVVEFDLQKELSTMGNSEPDTRFRMAGSNLFSKFKGVRIHLIEDLF